MSDKLNIRNEMARLDLKDRDFYNDLTDDERKKFSPFLMIRWGSSVQADRGLQEYYVQSTNHYLNKHFFTVNKHPRLQWLMATAVSPGLGKNEHPWIAPKKKEKGSNDVKKALLKLYPNMKHDEIELLSKLVDKKDIARYLKDAGSD
jgi:hypothetical protein